MDLLIYKKQRTDSKIYVVRKFIHRNELDKVFFQHDMSYGKSKDLTKKTQLNKVLKDKAFKIASDPKYDGHYGSMVYKFLIKCLMEVALTLNQIINL